MAETALAGKGGSIYVVGTPDVPMANVNTWTLNVEAGNYDASVLGDSWRHFVPGLRGWNGTVNAYYSVTTDPTGQLVFYNALFNGTQVVVQMQTSPTGGFFEGTCNVTGFAVSDPVDNLITLDFTFVGSGSLQHAP